MKRCAILLSVLELFILLFPLTIDGADNGNPFHFGFKKSKNGKLPSIDEEGFKDIVQKHGAIFLGDTSKKELYLTFDNRYENGYTPKVLDVLKSRQVQAAFFVTNFTPVRSFCFIPSPMITRML